jgi:hypothetical protein
VISAEALVKGAEAQGFEPWMGANPNRISSPLPSPVGEDRTLPDTAVLAAQSRSELPDSTDQDRTRPACTCPPCAHHTPGPCPPCAHQIDVRAHQGQRGSGVYLEASGQTGWWLAMWSNGIL